MKPIVLIHGYSAESEKSTKRAITGIYGDLPKALEKKYGADSVVEIDLSRYISLDDGLTLDDVSRALDRTLHADYAHLLRGGFHALVHSTGALVIRNWLRTFSPKPSPLRNLVYMAGANFGSGWAHVGKGQFAKWGRLIFQGTDRGVRILHGLELGSDWTIDLHRHFLSGANDMVRKYEVYEHVIMGTQADVDWFEAPIRYAKEDGADGVVRVAACNINFNYVRFAATEEARGLSWAQARSHAGRHMRRSGKREQFYAVEQTSRPGVRGRPVVPFAIPYECAHSGEKMGVVTGKAPREQVLRLLDLALRTTARNWQGRVERFDQETEHTYSDALAGQAPKWWSKWISEPRAQYDRHAQIVLRLRDQDGRPVRNYDVFFDSVQGQRDKSLAMRELIEHKHVNSQSPNIITFYLRTDRFDKDANDWVARVPEVDGCFLEISANEPDTDEILYMPMRFEFSAGQLKTFIRPHMTTVMDVELLRVPSPDVYRMIRY
jgi:hypothetical protein